jgi:hypothetical protein
MLVRIRSRTSCARCWAPPLHADPVCAECRMSRVTPDEMPAVILADPMASGWLKDAIRNADGRDPVDLATDAQILARILGARVAYVLGVA